CQQHSTYPYSF
nr:immunoglobulin light chain junction region [Macaca mulatta]